MTRHVLSEILAAALNDADHLAATWKVTEPMLPADPDAPLQTEDVAIVALASIAIGSAAPETAVRRLAGLGALGPQALGVFLVVAIERVRCGLVDCADGVPLWLRYRRALGCEFVAIDVRVNRQGRSTCLPAGNAATA